MEDDTDYNVCTDSVMKSPTTKSHNPLSMADLSWQISPGTHKIRQVQMEGVNMLARNFDECPSGYYGQECEFTDPCPMLAASGSMFRLGHTFHVYGIGKREEDHYLLQTFIARRNIDHQGGANEYNILATEGKPVIAYKNPSNLFCHSTAPLLIYQGQPVPLLGSPLFSLCMKCTTLPWVFQGS